MAQGHVRSPHPQGALFCVHPGGRGQRWGRCLLCTQFARQEGGSRGSGREGALCSLSCLTEQGRQAKGEGHTFCVPPYIPRLHRGGVARTLCKRGRKGGTPTQHTRRGGGQHSKRGGMQLGLHAPSTLYTPIHML
jgi:hypothetical protein